MAIGGLELFLGVGTILLLLYYHLVKNFDYWKKRRVLGPKPIPLFGNYMNIMFNRIHEAEYIKIIYHTYADEPFVGLYMRRNPVLILKDLELIKDVLVKSFVNFSERGVKINEDLDPLAQHLFHLEAKRWKPLRKRFTPNFSPGKLKEMFYLINDCANHFNEFMQNLADANEPVDCRELTSKYTTDVIGVCAFGLNMNALSNEDSEFRKIGRRIFQVNLHNIARRTVRFLPPWLGKLLRPLARDDKFINFFVTTVKENMEFRKKNNIRKQDFFDTLMDVKDHPESIEAEQISELYLTAQAYVFFAAGFETSSSTMSNAMYELALNPEIQDKLREEVNTTYAANDGKLSYDSLNSMKYLDKVYKETLRKYPSAVTIRRKATNDHTFPGTELSITKGTAVLIPAYSLQRDPKYYPDPDKFDPERFDEAIDRDRNRMTYLPFGDGPRNCIGARFANIQTKLGLAVAIQHFKLEVCEKTTLTYPRMVPGTTVLTPMEGLYLMLKTI